MLAGSSLMEPTIRACVDDFQRGLDALITAAHGVNARNELTQYP
jgi:hypothetical protein